MCDYSLEMYRSRPAVAGERYETRRFPSGSIGFVSPGDAQTAVCMACDTRLALSHIPAVLQQEFNIRETGEVTFAHLEAEPYHDGVRFADGTEVTLQRLGERVEAVVIDALDRDAGPAKTKELVFA